MRASPNGCLATTNTRSGIHCADAPGLNSTCNPFVPAPGLAVPPVGQVDSVQTVARELRKPHADIQKLSGSPMDYKRFMRQFNTRIVTYTDNDDERLNYLDQYMEADAHQIVVGYSHVEGALGYAAVIKEFEMRYGDPDVIAAAYVKRALDWPSIKADDAKALDQYSIFLMECHYAVKSVSAAKVLEYSDNMKRIVSKLPYCMYDKWRQTAVKAKDAYKPVTFGQLVDCVDAGMKTASKPA
jgi:hypothetical protein